MMDKTRLFLGAMLFVFAVLLVGPAAGQEKLREVTDDDVDRAIARTMRYIYGRQQANGHWPGHHETPAGGPTALCLFALLDAGEDYKSEAIQKGVQALIELKTTNLYVRSFRLMVLAMAGGREKPAPANKGKPEFVAQEKLHAAYLADKSYLMTNAAVHGAWGYGGPDRNGDNSCSQVALLAIWEILRAGEDVPADLARRVEATWIARNRKDGGWTYAAVGQGESTASMTAAGVASMFICQDALVGGICRPYPNKRIIDNGLAWLARELKPDFVSDGYLAFCVQRVGMAGGLKFIGDMDWFATGARELVKPQPYGANFRGQWGPDVGASFHLLFLARGRTPLVFNKLQLDDALGWDIHPRDIAQFALYMRKTFEERMRWQIVKLSDDIRMMLDAPILLVTAARALELSDDEWAKLREYSLRGGTLLFMPVHGNAGFTDSIKARLEKLYERQHQESPKNYSLVNVPADDPIYSAWKPMPNADKAIGFLGVHDGTRWVAILCPIDMACTWQKAGVRPIENHYNAAINLYNYATGRNLMASRMRPVFVGSDQPARETVRIGWIRHAGNWNTQPYALDYLSQKLSAENRVAIDLKAGVEPGKDELAGFRLLWLTGVDAVEFTDAQVAALRAYLDGNGTIFVNAIGGSEKFADSANKLIKRLGQGRDGARTMPAADHPLMNGRLGEHRGLPLVDLGRSYRWRVAARIPGPLLEAWVEGEHPRIIFAANGIHDTLDGHMSWSGFSYRPDSSGQVAANIVLYAMMDRPAPPVPAAAPASQPDEPAAQSGETAGPTE